MALPRRQPLAINGPQSRRSDFFAKRTSSWEWKTVTRCSLTITMHSRAANSAGEVLLFAGRFASWRVTGLTRGRIVNVKMKGIFFESILAGVIHRYQLFQVFFAHLNLHLCVALRHVIPMLVMSDSSECHRLGL